MITYDVTHCELLADDVTRVVLRPASNESILYQAGQYIKVVHRNDTLSPLSIACAPNKFSQIELHLAHPENNPDSHDILLTIAVEKKLILRGPYGSCTHTKIVGDGNLPIIFLARGTGFAPIKSIIEELKKIEKYPAMFVYWGATRPEELYLNELARRWTRELKDFSYTPVLSRQHTNWSGKMGLLQHIILQDHPNLANYQVYASAPEPIVHDAWHEFFKAGLPREHYFSDVFDYDPES